MADLSSKPDSAPVIVAEPPDSQDWHRQILDSTHEFISLLDRDHRYAFVNQTYETRLGLNRDELIGKRISFVSGSAVYEERFKPIIERCFM